MHSGLLFEGCLAGSRQGLGLHFRPREAIQDLQALQREAHGAQPSAQSTAQPVCLAFLSSSFAATLWQRPRPNLLNCVLHNVHNHVVTNQLPRIEDVF